MLHKLVFPILLLFSFNAVSATKEEYERFIYWTLLTSDDASNLDLAVRAMKREQLSDNSVLDVVAKDLWEFRSRQYDRKFADVLSWMAKDLGLSRLPRYRNILERSQAEFRNNEKIKEYVDDALKSVGQGDADDSFEPDKFSLDAIRGQLKEIRAANPAPVLTSEPVIAGGTPFEKIFEQYGLPDVMDASLRSASVPGLAHWDLSYLRVWYTQHMGFRFSFDKDNGKGWVLMDKWPLETSVALQYNGNKPGTALALWTNDVLLLQETAKRMYIEHATDSGLLDVMADRLWLSLAHPAPDYSDAFAWMCKVIEQSRDGRYATLMHDLIEKSTDSKVAKRAASALDELLNTQVNQYQRRDALK